MSKGHHSVSFFNRLSYKLTRTSLLMVLLIGLLVAIAQVFWDFKIEQRSVDNNVEKVFSVSQNAAKRAVHLLDERLAEEVVSGFTKYGYIKRVAILDDRGEILRAYDAESPSSTTLWITQWLVDERYKRYVNKLSYNDGTTEGQFIVVVDLDAAFSPFYERASSMLVIGLLRNISLALFLMFFYHYALTRPLALITDRFVDVDPTDPNGARIKHIKNHKTDELGAIVNAANFFIGSVEQRQLELVESEDQLRLIINSSPIQVYALSSSGEFVFLNTATADYYQSTVKELIGSNFHNVHSGINRDEADELMVIFKRVSSTRTSWMNVEKNMSTPDSNQKLAMQVSYIPFTYYGRSCVLVVSSDITDRVKAEKEIERLAYYDALTNLPNRNLFFNKLSKDIEITRYKESHGALLYIDLDEFKRINDTMGHDIGDKILIQLSHKMQSQIRQTDTLARLGSDEFTLSLPTLSSEREASEIRAAELAERLISIISTPIVMNQQKFLIGASIGIVMYPDNHDAGELLRFADTAMYQAKNKGRSCFRFFEMSMEEAARKRMDLEGDVRQALEEDHFVFYLQPIVEAETKRLVSAEALIRWPHPTKGMIFPDEYIGYLEDSGMITIVGKVVLEKTCAYLKQMKDARRLPEGFRIAVNISTVQFYQSDFYEQVEKTLTDFDIDGRYLEFEITESASLQRLSEAITMIKQLKTLNISFSLDDFGTGYSSLSYLKQLPVDKIKIDRSFVNDLTVDSQGEALVASIIAIAQNMNLNIVAEGVETNDQAEWLAKYDNVSYQGYLFDKPMPINDFSEKYLSLSYIQRDSQQNV